MQQATDDQTPSASKPKRLGGATGKGWLPGQSGNPLGRSRERRINGQTVAELARAKTHDELEAVQATRMEADKMFRDQRLALSHRLQAGELSRACSETILRRGWGDIPKGEALPSDVRIVVQQLAIEAKPVAGVICSPVVEHIATPHLVAAGGEVIDVSAEADEKCS